MKTKIKLVSLLFVVCTIFTPPVAINASAITAVEHSTVINLSGRQRMLTQKMSKEMLLIAAQVDVGKNRTELKKTSELFDSTLKGLRYGNKNMGLPATGSKVILDQLAKVESLWSEFKPIAKNVAAGGSVPVSDVARLNLPLLKNMNIAVGLYEKESAKSTGSSAGIVINLAGKQRMLTQKMSKEMLLIFLKHDTESNIRNLKETASLFGRTLKGLRDGDSSLNLPPTIGKEIIAQLGKVALLWKQFKPLVDTASNTTGTSTDNLSVTHIKKMSELNLPLLKEMNKAVKMYELWAKTIHKNMIYFQ